MKYDSISLSSDINYDDIPGLRSESRVKDVLRPKTILEAKKSPALIQLTL